MKQARVVGIGCFGRPQIFYKIFDRILESYSPAAVNAMGLSKKLDSRADGSPDVIMADSYAAPAENEPDFRTKTNRITGFYVSCSDNGLNFSVIARIH